MAKNNDLAQLKALVGIEGSLKIITNMHACQEVKGQPSHPDFPGFDAEKCAEYEYPLTDPRHFQLHDAVRLEQHPVKPELYIAFSEDYKAADGRTTHDETQGRPDALLRRLQEWRG